MRPVFPPDAGSRPGVHLAVDVYVKRTSLASNRPRADAFVACWMVEDYPISREAIGLTCPEPLLEVHGLKKHFPITRGVFSRTVGYVKSRGRSLLSPCTGEKPWVLWGSQGAARQPRGGGASCRLIEATEGPRAVQRHRRLRPETLRTPRPFDAACRSSSRTPTVR